MPVSKRKTRYFEQENDERLFLLHSYNQSGDSGKLKSFGNAVDALVIIAPPETTQ